MENLTQKDRDAIERIIYKIGDDIAISIARSLERFEERMDAHNTNLWGKLDELQGAIEHLTRILNPKN